eukprot:jgi/Chrzof1/11951/Cz06g15230.t1
MPKYKVVAVLPRGGEAADKEPKYVCCVERGLNLGDFLKERDCEFVCTDSKDGPDSELEKHIADLDILITTPFHPAYMDKDRLHKAKKLKLILTAGVGSDHIDLEVAAEKKITVAECSGSNVVSVAEDEIMRMLILLRNFVPAHEQIKAGDWDVAKVAVKSWDMQGKVIGTVGAGRIGLEVMKRLKDWDIKRLYYARHDKGDMDELGAQLVEDLDDFLGQCDVVTINLPLTDKTKHMFNKEVLGKMKKGAFLINNARGSIVDPQAIVEACESGQLAGYSGDVWDTQPAPKYDPWRKMPNHAMTAHTSGTTLDAQGRYQADIQHLLDLYFKDEKLPEEDLIVEEGRKASQYS